MPQLNTFLSPNSNFHKYNTFLQQFVCVKCWLNFAAMFSYIHFTKKKIPFTNVATITKLYFEVLKHAEDTTILC